MHLLYSDQLGLDRAQLKIANAEDNPMSASCTLHRFTNKKLCDYATSLDRACFVQVADKRPATHLDQ